MKDVLARCALAAALALLSAAPLRAAEPAEIPAFADGEAAVEGLDESVLQTIVKRAGETHSNALVILKNGKLIGQWYFGHTLRAYPLNSITKSVSALAVGKLLDERKIASIDVTLATFYPAWRNAGDPRSTITLRQVMAQASGLAEKEGGEQGDTVKEALAAALADKPGSRFLYNNQASNLISGVVKMASGKPLDQYVQENIFAPLGIDDWRWNKDAAGTPPTMGGLSLRALDLAKIGLMLANNGKYPILNAYARMTGYKTIVSESWVKTATAVPGVAKASADYGLFWWLLGHGEKGFMGRGYLGQYLIVIPGQKLVVVRQISEKAHTGEKDDFADLPELVEKLTQALQ